jgi:phage terminase large subunit-like protein
MRSSIVIADVPGALARLEAAHEKRMSENRLAYYKPYAKQADFHAAGADKRERLLMAANQVGKTWSAGFETAMHATGRYPDWWKGKRFDRPIVAWAAGETSEVVRDNSQRILVGRDKPGTGAIPKDAILERVSARGIADALDTIKVQHVSGGHSTISFKAYASGREKFQGETLDFVWCDEEPPLDIYTECLTRTNVSQGPVYVTFTPLNGMSDVVARFLNEESPDRHVTYMTIDDAEHYTPEQRQKIIDSYPAHERDARTKGIPVLGSGLIFPVPEESLYCEPRDWPDHWPRIGGMDFGWDHPFAAVEVVWDRDADTVYVNRTYRASKVSVIEAAAALRPWGNIKWAWPHDGRNETQAGAGVSLAKQYKAQMLDMLHDRAAFEDGSISVEAGLMDMLTRMQTGRFKVMRHLNDWFEEFRQYHRKDGKVVKVRDDLMSATRYAIMMLRYATCVNDPKRLRIESYKVRTFMRQLSQKSNTTWMN